MYFMCHSSRSQKQHYMYLYDADILFGLNYSKKNFNYYQLSKFHNFSMEFDKCFKLKPRLTKFRYVNRALDDKKINELGETREIMLTNESPHTDFAIYTNNSLDERGAYNQTMDIGNGGYVNNIHHFTDEYYLSYLTKHYDFSLTHNDLISVEKNSIPRMIKKMNDYLISVDPKLELEHIEVIDHNIYRNDYLLFSFSKVFVENYFHYTTNKTKCYITEFVAFSKYPKDKNLIDLISNISKILYEDIREQDIYSNMRLIDMSKEPSMSLTFNKLTVNNKKEIISTSVSLKEINVDNNYYPFLDIDMLLSDYVHSEDKLLILYGNTGSGKTKLSNKLGQHLADQSYELYTTTGSELENANIISYISNLSINQDNREEKFDKLCLIIDDLEPKMLNRTKDDTKSIFNELITLLDGNFDINVKVVITTNYIIEKKEDGPLYRAGRLFDTLFIRYLTKTEAKNILKSKGIQEAKIKSFLQKQEGDEVKQANVAQLISETNNKITKSYYKEDKKARSKTQSAGFIK